MNNFKIDYAIITVDENPEYTDLLPYITRRWNQLGIKVILIKLMNSGNYQLIDRYMKFESDQFGNLTALASKYSGPKILDRWFTVMAVRFFIPQINILDGDQVVVISDADLFPINKRYIYRPSYRVNMDYEVNTCHRLVATNIYPNEDVLATYIYGKVSTFRDIFNYQSFSILIDDAQELAYKNARMYANDEHFINWKFNQVPSRIYKIKNRKFLEMVHEMNNLYDFQIDLLESPSDLAPFIEFHSMRSSTMTMDRWNWLFSLLGEYDQMDLAPNNWFYETIDSPWKDNILTADGELILGRN